MAKNIPVALRSLPSRRFLPSLRNVNPSALVALRCKRFFSEYAIERETVQRAIESNRR